MLYQESFRLKMIKNIDKLKQLIFEKYCKLKKNHDSLEYFDFGGGFPIKYSLTYKFDYDIVNVLFYMQDEPFYALETLSEEVNLYQRLLEIDKSFYYIKLDFDLIKLLTNSTTRQQLRDVLEEMLN